MAFEVKQVLRMKEGTDEISYAKSSYIQKQVLSMTKSIKEEAIKELYYKKHPKIISIADLGCSSAELNTLGLVSELIAAVEGARRRRGDGPLEYHVCLNDLPGNDFNTVFRSLANFEEKLQKETMMRENDDQYVGDEGFGHCFVNGVPGSFYGRLFPSNTLHFVHSSYSLMWLSQIPQGVEENKGNIYIAKTSPPSVVEAYFNQFRKDFTMFLRCRSKELIVGGKMVLTILGKKINEAYTKESSYMWDILATVLNNMVTEGFIEEEKLNTFNMPFFAPSPTEVGLLVEEEGSFALDRAHVSQVSWQKGSNYYNRTNGGSFDEGENCFDSDECYDFVKCMRSVSEPLLTSHFGEGIVEEVFQRYSQIVRVSMLKEKNAFVNVTVSMTRRDNEGFTLF